MVLTFSSMAKGLVNSVGRLCSRKHWKREGGEMKKQFYTIIKKHSAASERELLSCGYMDEFDGKAVQITVEDFDRPIQITRDEFYKAVLAFNKVSNAYGYDFDDLWERLSGKEMK
jgi:hypothetical protein